MVVVVVVAAVGGVVVDAVMDATGIGDWSTLESALASEGSSFIVDGVDIKEECTLGI